MELGFTISGFFKDELYLYLFLLSMLSLFEDDNFMIKIALFPRSQGSDNLIRNPYQHQLMNIL